MKFSGYVVSILFLLASFSAQAQVVALECDGHIPCTLEQFKAGVVEWYNKADINHDGVVDGPEQGAFWNKYLKTILPNCHNIQDLNVLVLNKLPKDSEVQKIFVKIDLNGDGKIDASEDAAATQQLDQACAMLNDPEMQKIREMIKQMQQQKQKLNNPSPKPAQ